MGTSHEQKSWHTSWTIFTIKVVLRTQYLRSALFRLSCYDNPNSSKPEGVGDRIVVD